jgi:two-component system, OmpR family, alkaline phosphatase synthesis response regulator PhoP
LHCFRSHEKKNSGKTFVKLALNFQKDFVFQFKKNLKFIKIMNILIVEDDDNIAELLSINLKDLPALTTVKNNGWQGLDEALTGKYDLVVLDVMLPGLNGLEICRQVRHKLPMLPILMLTAKSEEADKIKGLETGADDYLTKPFSIGELKARVKSVMRRTQVQTKQLEKNLIAIQRGELRLDLENHYLMRGGQRIDLTPKEFELLQLFMQNPGRSFSRQHILDEVWGEQFEGLEHTVNSHINRLRAKIEENPLNPNYILTAWGVGYMFNNEL